MNCKMTLWPLTLEILLLQILITRCEKIYDPTLKPVSPFKPDEDATTLHDEMSPNQLWNNLDKLARIWFHRTHEQRMQIAEAYQKKCWGSVVGDLQGMSVHSLDDLYSDSIRSPHGLLGDTVYEAIAGTWTEVGAIEEILCCNDKDIKEHMDDYYKSAHGDTIENHLKTFKKENQEYQHVLQQHCWKGLCQEKKIKPEDAVKEAKALRGIDPENDGDRFKTKLNELLDKNCEPDMKLIFEKYRQADNGIVDAVEKAFKDEMVERAYNRLVRYIEDTCKFYADELEEAATGCGNDIDRINRIVLSRCERDLGCILKKYQEIHGKTFTRRLTSETWNEPRYHESIRYLCGKT